MVSLRFALIVVLWLSLLFLQFDTFASMVRGWMGSTTYNHGFVIPLIAAFFAWQRRDDARVTNASTWWPGLLIIAVLVGIWAIGDLVNVQVVAQLASVSLIAAIVLTVAGPRQVAVFALPLAYLLFAVPFGQGIVPALMEWTADFTVGALQLFGIPVIRDGMYFSTSSGSFEVAEACSGVRYLLASLAAGVAFAFLTYEKWWKRALFIAASVVVPILANGLRAFFIVLIAHFSDMKLAMGVDHFIYGWFFFGVVILALFWVGSRFADERPDLAAQQSTAQTGNGPAAPERSSRLMAVGAGVLLLLAAGTAFTQYRAVTGKAPSLRLPSGAALAGDWTGPESPESDWRLDFQGASADVVASYTHTGGTVEIRVAAYVDQQQGAELINHQNRIAQPEWDVRGRGTAQMGTELPPEVRRASIGSRLNRHEVWYWYQQGKEATVSNYRAKWLETLAVFEPSSAMVIAVGVRGTGDDADERLAAFLEAAGDSLIGCLTGDTVTGCVEPPRNGVDEAGESE
jgi:exosortase A